MTVEYFKMMYEVNKRANSSFGMDYCTGKIKKYEAQEKVLEKVTEQALEHAIERVKQPKRPKRPRY